MNLKAFSLLVIFLCLNARYAMEKDRSEHHLKNPATFSLSASSGLYASVIQPSQNSVSPSVENYQIEMTTTPSVMARIGTFMMPQTENGMLVYALLFSSLLSLVLLLGWNNSRLKKEKTELEDLNAARDRLLAIIAHDLRAPVTTMEGLAKNLDKFLKKEDSELLRKIGPKLEYSASNLSSLVENLLTWALKQNGAIPFQPTIFPISEMIEESVAQYMSTANEKGINIVTDLDPDLNVFADRNSTSVVFRNLVSNGIKFTSTAGTVGLYARRVGSDVKVWVQDTGNGMSEKEMKGIFCIKSQKSTRGTQGEKGTGLGLTVCKEMIEMNKGSISVSSKLGEGTEFLVSLPAA